MYQSKVDEKINEYRLKLAKFVNLSSETEIFRAANELLFNSKINQACNYFGYSFFNSPDVERLKTFISANFNEEVVQEVNRVIV